MERKKDFNQYIAQSFHYSDKFEQEKLAQTKHKIQNHSPFYPKDLINSLHSFIAHENMVALKFKRKETLEDKLFEKIELKKREFWV